MNLDAYIEHRRGRYSKIRIELYYFIGFYFALFVTSLIFLIQAYFFETLNCKIGLIPLIIYYGVKLNLSFY